MSNIFKRNIDEKFPKAGKDLYLTIDIELQKFMFSKLSQYVGSSVVINPKNGEITKIRYSSEMPLTNELKYFISRIDGGDVEISRGLDGLDVIKILESASNSLLKKKYVYNN